MGNEWEMSGKRMENEWEMSGKRMGKQVEDKWGKIGGRDKWGTSGGQVGDKWITFVVQEAGTVLVIMKPDF